MQIRPLIWEFVGSEKCLWRGVADGLLRHVSFSIVSGDAENEFILRTGLSGIDDKTCIGLEVAKTKAQDLLDSYALSLIIF